jgi:hypothetical protein
LGGEDYGGEGRKMEDTTAWPTSDLVGRTEQSKGYCGRSGDVYAQIVFTSAHPPTIFVVNTFFPSRFRRLMAGSEMDFTILLQQRDKEIAGLKADLRATRAQHTADLASTASAANDLVAAAKGTAHDGTTADIVSAATELAVLLAAAADSAADQSAIVGDAEAIEDHESAADLVKANDYDVNLGATADIDRLHGDVGRGEIV